MEGIHFKASTVKLGLAVASLICFTLLMLSLIGIHDLWPASLLLLFYFENGAKREKIKTIYSGATVGLLYALGVFFSVEQLTPLLGLQVSIYTMVFLAVFLLIVLGDLSHMLFNNYAFCYFTVALIFQTQSTLKWLFVLYAGGGILLAGASYFINRIHKNEAPGRDPVHTNSNLEGSNPSVNT